MTDYEILLMLDPELEDERQNEIVSRVREQVERSGGSWQTHDVWGRRRLQYEIDHKNEGNYHLLEFTAAREALEEVSRVLRIHADGSSDRSQHGVSTLYPAWHRGWTDDIYTASLRAARLVQSAVVHSTGAANLGLIRRWDLTGFNWANVPAILVETGFLSNPSEATRLHTASYQERVARGLAAGAGAFVG